MNALAELDYYKYLDEMIAESTKKDLAECARLLALNLAQYKAKYGELPLEDHQAMLEAKLLANGVLEMTLVLATVTGRFEEWLKALSTPIH